MNAFEYISADKSTVKRYPFRVGDIVTVKNWGESYPTYRMANRFFTGSEATPHYSRFDYDRSRLQKFKIIKIAEHSDLHCRTIIAYIRDREGKGAIIGLDGLKLDKQYPLRINETKQIKLEKICL